MLDELSFDVERHLPIKSFFTPLLSGVEIEASTESLLNVRRSTKLLRSCVVPSCIATSSSFRQHLIVTSKIGESINLRATVLSVCCTSSRKTRDSQTTRESQAALSLDQDSVAHSWQADSDIGIRNPLEMSCRKTDTDRGCVDSLWCSHVDMPKRVKHAFELSNRTRPEPNVAGDYLPYGLCRREASLGLKTRLTSRSSNTADVLVHLPPISPSDSIIDFVVRKTYFTNDLDGNVFQMRFSLAFISHVPVCFLAEMEISANN